MVLVEQDHHHAIGDPDVLAGVVELLQRFVVLIEPVVELFEQPLVILVAVLLQRPELLQQQLFERWFVIRNEIDPRSGWQDTVRNLGLGVDNPEDYWREDAYYVFTEDEAKLIGDATRSCYDVLAHAGDAMFAYHDGEWLRRIGIPEKVIPALKRAWDNEPPALNYGRMDFGYDGANEPKLFEFNCDSPTQLLEAAVLQAQWAGDVLPGYDQFNVITQELMRGWARIAPQMIGKTIHFTCVPNIEDECNTHYMQMTADLAGLPTKFVYIPDIGLTAGGELVDDEDIVMRAICKLYPWQWLMNESYADAILSRYDSTVWIEPIWKMLWENKGVLSLAKSLEPDNPFLLDTSFVKPSGGSYVEKPVIGRGGANVRVMKNSVMIGRGKPSGIDRTDGEFGTVFQQFVEIPEMAENTYPVIGSWIVAGIPAGIGVREGGLVTGDDAVFVPHIVEG